MTEAKVYDIDYYLNKEYNRTSLYLFPMIYKRYVITPNLVGNPEEHGFRMVNLFLGDDERPEYSNYYNNDHLLMLIQIVDYENRDFQFFINEIQKNKFFHTYYHVAEKLMMIVFTVSDEYKEIIYHFKHGKYSKFSKEYSYNFLYDANTKIKSSYNIITRNPFLKSVLEREIGVKLPEDAELDSRPYENEEVFRYHARGD